MRTMFKAKLKERRKKLMRFKSIITLYSKDLTLSKYLHNNLEFYKIFKNLQKSNFSRESKTVDLNSLAKEVR